MIPATAGARVEIAHNFGVRAQPTHKSLTRATQIARGARAVAVVRNERDASSHRVNRRSTGHGDDNGSSIASSCAGVA